MDETAVPWIRLLVVYLLIPLILFLCAWDMNWWQGWIFAAMFLIAGLGGRAWAESRHPGISAERQNAENIQNAKSWDKILAPLMAISSSFPIVIVAGLDHRFDWSPELSTLPTVAGFILIAIGYAFSAWAFAENRFFLSMVTIQTDHGHTVCDTGPYRIVRHPGYAGNALALIGIVLALHSVWTLIPVAVALVITVVRTALEDKTLQEELSGYREFSQVVRSRLIPGIY